MENEATKKIEEARDALAEALFRAVDYRFKAEDVTAAIGDLIDAKLAQFRADQR